MHTVVNNTSFFIHGKSGAWNVVLCTINVVSSTYQYTNGSFHTLTTTNADLNMTKHIATMLSSNYLTQRVPNTVEGTGLVSGDYVSSFALELSQELARMSVSIYEPGAVSDLVQLVPGIGAKLQLAPLVLLVAVLLIYWWVSFLRIGHMQDLTFDGQPDYIANSHYRHAGEFLNTIHDACKGEACRPSYRRSHCLWPYGGAQKLEGLLRKTI